MEFQIKNALIKYYLNTLYVIPRIPEYIHYIGIFHYFPALPTQPSVLLSPCTPIRINKALSKA